MTRNQELKKIGMLGGSFDPIHVAHIHMGLHAIKNFNLDKVFYVVAKSSPFKKNKVFLKVEDRYNLVEKALEKYPKLEASRIEIDREADLSYTYQTVQDFKNKYPNSELFWLLGNDAFKDLDNWKNSEFLLKNLKFIVFSRLQNLDQKDLDFVHYVSNFDYPISSTEIREEKVDLSWVLPKEIIEDYKDLLRQKSHH